MKEEADFEDGVQVYFGTHYACDACGWILDADDRLLVKDFASPCCGAQGFRMVWPDDAAEFAGAISVIPETDFGLRMAAVMASAAAEAHLRCALWVYCDRLPPMAAQALMKRASQRNPSLQLYKDIVGKPVRKILDPLLPGWFDAWDSVVRARNSYGHGRWHQQLKDNQKELTWQVLNGDFLPKMNRAFALLTNQMVEARKKDEEFMISCDPKTAQLLARTD